MTVVLADLVAERRDLLEELEKRLRETVPSPMLTDSRLLQLSGPVIVCLAELEEAVHRLLGWLQPGPKA